MKLHPMWEGYPSLKDELTETLKKMEDVIRLKNKPVEQAIKETIHAGGKLLRPAYQLLFSQFGPENDQAKAIALAASIEMLHTATLIHDDIVDEANIRRGKENIRGKFGNTVAVYAGDYLLVCCFKLLSNYSTSLKSLQTNSRSMEKILDGELGQMDNRYNYHLKVEEYLENISGKTAELFQLSCSIGAYESGTTERFAKKVGTIGLAIGMAFQIMDDVLDYTKSSNEIGKPVLEDMRQGVYSLPLIYALQTDKKAELISYLDKKDTLTSKEIEKVRTLVAEAKGIDKAKELAEKYTKKSLSEINKLPDNSFGTKENLLSLTSLILEREN